MPGHVSRCGRRCPDHRVVARLGHLRQPGSLRLQLRGQAVDFAAEPANQ